MNIESWIKNRVFSGEDATVSFSVIEMYMGDYFFGSRLKQWVDSFAKELNVKATIFWSSDIVTFYPYVGKN